MSRKQRGFTLIELLIVLAVLFGVIALIATLLGKKSSNKVTLKFERCTAFAGALCDVEVFVNGLKLGAVENGDTVSFDFIPAPSGTNKLRAELIALMGPNTKSEEMEFTAHPGAVIYVRSEFDGWKTEPQFNLAIATEREGTVPPPQIASATAAPAPAAEVPAAPVATPTTSSAVTWEAIGAIAGIGSLLLAVASMFLRK